MRAMRGHARPSRRSRPGRRRLRRAAAGSATSASATGASTSAAPIPRCSRDRRRAASTHLRGREHLVLVAPSPVAATGASGIMRRNYRGRDDPCRAHPRARSLAAEHVQAPLARGALRAARSTTPRRPTPRSPRCASAARPATTASPRGWSPTRSRDGRPDARPAARALGAAPRRRRRVRSMAALCVARSADGRWLAGRRAAWLSSWAGRWALGAGGAVDVGESPADTLAASCTRSGRSRPSASASRRSCACRHGLVMLVGMAWLPEGAEVDDGRRARRLRVVARRRRATGPTRPTSRCAAWPRCSPPAE